NPQFRAHYIEQIAQALAVDDVEKATAVWQQLPEDNRVGTAGRIVSIWAQKDRAGATRWVTSLPPGDARQRALTTLLIMMHSSPDASNFAQLLTLVESSEDRDTYGYNRIAALLRQGHRATAEAELGRLTLSPDTYRRARELLDSN